MSEVIKSVIAKDEGRRSRWGLSNILYRKEGKKLSLNTKITAWFFTLFMLLGSLYSIVSEFFKPTPSANSIPIAFNKSLAPNFDEPSGFEIPYGNSESKKSSQMNLKTKAIVRYGGTQIIQRPNMGKIPAGTMVKAKFITGASKGLLKAELAESLIVHDEEISPIGSILIGVGSSGEERLSVQFSKLVYKNGEVKSIQAQACDISDQSVGLKGEKVSRYASLLATSAALNFVGGMAEGLRESKDGEAGKKSDLRNAALNGVSKAAVEQSQNVLNDIKNKKSVIQIQSGQEFYVLFEGE